jgi:hypothetical protein
VPSWPGSHLDATHEFVLSYQFDPNGPDRWGNAKWAVGLDSLPERQGGSAAEIGENFSILWISARLDYD